MTSLPAQEDPAFTQDEKSPSLSRRHTPEKQLITSTGPARGRSMNFGSVSLGSPKMKSSRSNQDQPTDDLLSIDEKDTSMIVETAQRSVRRSSRRSKPIKLKLPLPATSSETTLPRDGTQVQTVPVTLPSSQTGSRPGTPLTSMSRTSDSSSARFAKVFRVGGTPKAETPPPASSVPSVSSVLVSKARSRRASISISSPSRPVTPGDLLSDCEPNTSESVSRANSPPFSRISSAPVRAVSKSQAKKERRLKAKQAEAKKEDLIGIPTIEEPVQGPILGRKRKAKKAPGVAAEQSLDVSIGLPETGKPTESAEDSAADKVDQKLDPAKRNNLNDSADKDVRFISVDEMNGHQKMATSEPWKSNNTLEQLIKDSQASGISIKELFLERTSSLQLLLAQLHDAGTLDLNSHPLFNPPNLNQRFDMKCSPDDYSHLRHPIELSEEHRKKLLRGEPVRINDNSNLYKNKCMITPRGCVLRHLSTEEEDRYLILEKSISATSIIQEYPALSITDPDLTNREGGLDALFATPEKFNIRWVDERPQTGLTSESIAAVESSGSPNVSIQPDIPSSIEIKARQGPDWTSANTAELINATAASVRNFAVATAKHVLGTVAALGGDLPDTEDVCGMSDTELRSFIDKSQRELETARKEFDAIDKRLAALVKRNKKLVHQALATTLE